MPRISFHTTGKPNESTSFVIPYTVITDGFLDEELDVCPIEIKHTSVETPFPRFCVASLYVAENAKPKYFLVASDRVGKSIATGLCDHTIDLVEPTKWLERFMVGNKTVTQPLYTDYLENPITTSIPTQIPGVYAGLAQDLLPRYNESGVPYVSYKTPIKPGTAIPIYNVRAFDVSGRATKWSCTLRIGNHTEVFEQYDSENGIDTIYKHVTFEKEVGLLTITYQIETTTGSTVPIDRIYVAKYEVVVIAPEDVPALYTLRDASMSMLCAAEILKSNNGVPIPRFKLNPNIEKELDKIVSPEITVTNATLREALDEIGKVINSITCLDVVPGEEKFTYEVTFEKYCKSTPADLSELGSPSDISIGVSCEDYCTALDATVDNLVNYREGGSVWDPCYELWRTVRTEDASYRVTEDTAEILTVFPIERLDALWCRVYDESGGFKDIDLTKYLFEAAEYATLSSYTVAYPHTKAYALCYTLGQKSITGLNFTVPSPVHPIFEKPALVNIINKELGTAYNNLNVLDFTKLLFKVKYVPTGTARVVVRKPDSFGKTESVLAYNQSAAKIDAIAFGRSVFGAALRMGNKEAVYTYVASPIAHVPEKGERFGEDGYIAEIREEYAPQQKKVTITVIEGFNRLSQFVGVNKTQRLFEISERMSLDRHIVYEDKCLISTSRHAELSGAITSNAFLERLKSVFTGVTTGAASFFATTRGYDRKGNALAACFHPCIPYAMGNAVIFAIAFEDNYSAGRRIDTVRTTNHYSTETDVRYTDLFGRVAELTFSVDDGFSTNGIAKEEHMTTANVMPEQPEVVKNKSSPIVLAAESNRLYIDKDSREAIRTLAYQVSFLGDDKIKVSSVLAEKLPYAPKNGNIFQIAYLPKGVNLNNTTEWIDTSVCTTAFSSSCEIVGDTTLKVNFPAPGVAVDGWACFDWTNANADADDRLKPFLFGKNVPIAAKENITVYFNFYH